MTVLNVNYADPGGPYASRHGDVSAAIQQAFSAWMSHFDTPRGTVSVKVTFTTLGGNFAASGGYNSFKQVGGTAKKPVYMSGFGYEVATGAGLSDDRTSGQLNLDRTWFDRTFGNAGTGAAEGQRVLQHEFGHILGFVAATSTASASAVAPSSHTTVYDQYLQFSSGSESFVGPNAVRSYAGIWVTS